MTSGPNYLFSRLSFMRLIDITAIIVTRAIKCGQGTRCLGLRANSPRLIVAVCRRLINITPVCRWAGSGHTTHTETIPPQLRSEKGNFNIGVFDLRACTFCVSLKPMCGFPSCTQFIVLFIRRRDNKVLKMTFFL